MYEYTARSRLSGVPIWERGQFVYGGGVYAPGGPGGGVTFGPMFRQPGQLPAGPGSCSQIQGGRSVCVGAPYGPRGEEKVRGWPPEVGPQAEGLMEQGCVPTGRRCGGSVRSPSQEWCCPGDALFVGSPFPTVSDVSGLGTNGESGGSIWGYWWVPLALVIGGAFVALEIGDLAYKGSRRSPW